jgi:hypothetical protein
MRFIKDNLMFNRNFCLKYSYIIFNFSITKIIKHSFLFLALIQQIHAKASYCFLYFCKNNKDEINEYMGNKKFKINQIIIHQGLFLKIHIF